MDDILDFDDMLKKKGLVHVDDWVLEPCLSTDPEAYAKFFFVLRRTHAWMQMAFAPWIKEFKLYCTYEGETYRITGASRLGDIWLIKDLSKDAGYDIRTYVNKVSNFRREP